MTLHVNYSFTCGTTAHGWGESIKQSVFPISSMPCPTLLYQSDYHLSQYTVFQYPYIIPTHIPPGWCRRGTKKLGICTHPIVWVIHLGPLIISTLQKGSPLMDRTYLRDNGNTSTYTDGGSGLIKGRTFFRGWWIHSWSMGILIEFYPKWRLKLSKHQLIFLSHRDVYVCW